MGKVIVIASGKGGTGKTTLTANLGAALSKKEKSVVVVDMDMGLRNLDVALGLESSIVYDVADVIEGTCTLDDALIKHSSFDSLFFIPAPQTRDASSIGTSVIALNTPSEPEHKHEDFHEPAKLSDSEADETAANRNDNRNEDEYDSDEKDDQDNTDENTDEFKAAEEKDSKEPVTLEQIWRDFWTRLAERFDYCIIDSPAGIEGGFKYAVYGADEAIIVTLAETAALRDADRVVDVFEDAGIEDVHLVINRIRPDMITKGIMMNIDTCIEMLEIPILGIIGDDEELISSSLKGELAVNNELSHAGTAIRNIAARILGDDVPIMEFKDNSRKSIWDRIKSIFFKRKG
ncbi:MAG: AAA family ATPase [bacterium]|nr:AAA family ATPase [bacterium]